MKVFESENIPSRSESVDAEYVNTIPTLHIETLDQPEVQLAFAVLQALLTIP